MNINKAKYTDICAWSGVAVLLMIAIVATNVGKLPGPIIAIVWIVWALLSVGLAYLTQQGKACLDFANDAKTEMSKVVWPSRQETTQTTLMVIVMVTVTGIILWGVDSAMLWAIGKITQLG